MTNDLDSPTYDATQQTGLYVYAPDATQLDYAFNRVASEILRLAQ
jgi:hypothetical protein